jgi:hypothetical protein
MEPVEIDAKRALFLPAHRRVTFAKDQAPYQPLPAVLFVQDPKGRAITRWTFTLEERALIAAGEDLYLEQLTFNEHFQPILPTVGLRDFCQADS